MGESRGQQPALPPLVRGGGPGRPDRGAAQLTAQQRRGHEDIDPGVRPEDRRGRARLAIHDVVSRMGGGDGPSVTENPLRWWQDARAAVPAAPSNTSTRAFDGISMSPSASLTGKARSGDTLPSAGSLRQAQDRQGGQHEREDGPRSTRLGRGRCSLPAVSRNAPRAARRRVRGWRRRSPTVAERSRCCGPG